MLLAVLNEVNCVLVIFSIADRQLLKPDAEVCLCVQAARHSMVLFVHGKGSAIMQGPQKPILHRQWQK